MKKLLAISTLSIAGIVALNMPGVEPAAKSAASTCYKSSDPSFFSIVGISRLPNPIAPIRRAAITNGEQGTDFINTATQAVDNAGSGARAFMTSGLRFHTIGESTTLHSNECNWTRWYQTEGRIQGFRLFQNEYNSTGSSNISPRVEAFGGITGWTGRPAERTEYSWSGRYQILEPEEGSLFQLKHNSNNDWAVMLRLTESGEIYILPRGQDPVYVGDPGDSPFGVRVFDTRTTTGTNYQTTWKMVVEFPNEPAVSVSGTKDWSNNPNEVGQFRWGIYHDGQIMTRDSNGNTDASAGNKTVSQGAKVLVAGAQWGSRRI